MTAKELFDFILKMEKEHDPNEDYSNYTLQNISDEVISQTQQMLIEAGSQILIITPAKKQDLKVNITYDQIVE